MRISDWSSDVCSSDLTMTSQQMIALLEDLLKFLGSTRYFNIGFGRRLQRRQLVARIELVLHHVAAATHPAIQEARERWATTSFLRIDRDERRSEERRVGKECVSTCRSRWSQYH